MNDVVDLTSDGDDGDDEVVIVSSSSGKHDGRANSETRGSANKRQKTASHSVNEPYDEEKAERIQTRTVRKLVSFHASWLRGLKGFKEAKAKACLGTPLQSATSPEAQVLARAKEFFRQRKEKGQTYKYVFERCYDEEMKSRQHIEKGNIRGAAGEVDDCNSLQDMDNHLSETRDRNRAISCRLRSLVSAEAALEEFRRVNSDKYRGTIDEGDDVSGRALTDVQVKEKARTKKQQQPFRKMQYDRVARIVESYPVAVTLDCLDPPPKFAALHAPASQSNAFWEKSTVRKIKCGGSVRDRLIRAVLYVDKNPLLYGDDMHRRDEAVLKNRDVHAINHLRKIWGVGITTAARLTSWGVYSVADLRRDTEVFDALNRQQKVGLERYEDISLSRIPRPEVEAIRLYVSATVAELSSNQVTVAACGSYRRGASSSGDVDLILLPNERWSDPSSPPDSGRRGAPDDAAVQIIHQVLEKLRGDGFLTDDLTVPNQYGENDGETPGTDSRSYMGVCRLLDRPDRKYRRIDIKAYPGCQGPFALLYFTGDTHFNRSMRAFAKKAGLTMSDAGLACCDRNRIDGKLKRTKTYGSVRCRKEEDVFAALGIGYVTPRYRNCGRFESRSRDNMQRWDDRFLVESDESDDED